MRAKSDTFCVPFIKKNLAKFSILPDYRRLQMLCIPLYWGGWQSFKDTYNQGERLILQDFLNEWVTKVVAFNLHDFNVGMCRKLPKRKKAKIVSIN